MIHLVFLATLVKGYEEALALVSLDHKSSLAVFNISIPGTESFNLGYFPASVKDIKANYSATFAWGQPHQLAQSRLNLIDLQLGVHGFTLETNFEADWSLLGHLLSGLVCTGNSELFPITIGNSKWVHTKDFLCKENLVQAVRLLPCKNTLGLATLFESLLKSPYLMLKHQVYHFGKTFSYNLVIVAEVPSKGPLKNINSECINTKLHVLEDDILETHPFSSIQLSKLFLKQPTKFKESPVESRRSIADVRYEFFATYFHNIANKSNETQTLRVTEVLPKSTDPLLHTCSLKPSSVSKLNFGWVLSFSFDLEPFSSKTISFRVQKRMLGFEEYPNDPQRGWDLPSTPLFYNQGFLLTQSLLVMTPEPDFSMPFNVICITCTAIGFFFTSLQTLHLWKQPTHWSHPQYSSQVAKANKYKNVLKNVFLAVSLGVLVVLDRYGIIKLLG